MLFVYDILFTFDLVKSLYPYKVNIYYYSYILCILYKLGIFKFPIIRFNTHGTESTNIYH